MKILCIDMGNTRVHCSVINDKRIEKSVDFKTHNFSKTFSSSLKKFKNIDGIAWCSVVPKESKIFKEKVLSKIKLPNYELNYKNCPIKIDLKKPKQCGGDRLAAAIGASLFFKPPYIVIDMGTALTIDLVDAKNQYAGGAIAPGLHAFTLYLHERTALLPSINPLDVDYDIVVGKDTQEAMGVGCIKGFCRLIDGIIADFSDLHFKSEKINKKTIFTGGSLSLLPKKWLAKRKIECNLVNLGLFQFFKKIHKGI